MLITDELKTNLYSDYHGKILGYIQSRVNNAVLAEDLCADVFLKVYEKLDTFDEKKASLSTWIYTVARNTLTDYYRTRRVTEEIPETYADGSDVEESVISAEILDVLADALEALPERERDIIVLRYYSGKTLKDIGQKLGISYAYVKLLHNKALAQMRDFFE